MGSPSVILSTRADTGHELSEILCPMAHASSKFFYRQAEYVGEDIFITRILVKCDREGRIVFTPELCCSSWVQDNL